MDLLRQPEFAREACKKWLNLRKYEIKSAADRFVFLLLLCASKYFQVEFLTELSEPSRMMIWCFFNIGESRAGRLAWSTPRVAYANEFINCFSSIFRSIFRAVSADYAIIIYLSLIDYRHNGIQCSSRCRSLLLSAQRLPSRNVKCPLDSINDSIMKHCFNLIYIALRKYANSIIRIQLGIACVHERNCFISCCIVIPRMRFSCATDWDQLKIYLN